MVTVAISGFRPYIQKNVHVEALGDVTVNAALQVGNARDAITVEATPVAVEFNSSTMSNTVDTKMANTLPLVSRNPFLFVELNPAVVPGCPGIVTTLGFDGCCSGGGYPWFEHVANRPATLSRDSPP